MKGNFRIYLITICLGILTFIYFIYHYNSQNIKADEAIQLSAEMITPVDIKLKWNDPVPNAAGYIVEYTNDFRDSFVIVSFLPPNTTTFTHPSLIPDTTFYYRVRAYYGPASNPVKVSLPERLTYAEYTARFNVAEDYSWAVPIKLPDCANTVQKSIRNSSTLLGAAPKNLKASHVSKTVSGFKLTWSDYSVDEDAFILEKNFEKKDDLTVCAVIDPNINSFGWAFEPPVRQGSFRIRAIYFGKASNTIKMSTGVRPTSYLQKE